MAFVNLVEQELAMSLVHATAVFNKWPLPKHDPALDVKLADLDDKEEDAGAAAKPKTKKKLEREAAAREKLKAEREALKKDIEAKRAAEALVQAEIKKNAVYVKLMQLADSKSYDELLDAVLSASIKSQNGAAITEADFDLIYSLALSLWSTAKNPASYITKFVTEIQAGLGGKYSLAAIKLLLILFNTLVADSRVALSPQRYFTFTQLLNFSLKTNNAKLLDGQFKHVDSWTKEWKLNTNESADLNLLISEVLRAAGQPAESQSYVLKYLTILDKADKKTIDAAKPHAYGAVVAALNSTTVYQFDTLLTLAAVKALEGKSGDAKYDTAYSLLKVFTSEGVEAFNDFSKKNKDFIAQAGLNGEELLRKIRTLTLCSLGLEKERLSFDVLRQKLQVADTAAVEASVLDAVISQCVEAKIDEANEEVIILRTTRRSFDSSGWKSLAVQLGEWKKNVSAVLATLHQIQNRALVPSTPAAQDHKS